MHELTEAVPWGRLRRPSCRCAGGLGHHRRVARRVVGRSGDRPGGRRCGGLGGAIICNGCRNWWTGLGAAHCSSCQRTLPRPGNGPLGEELRTPARPRRQTMGGLVPARHLERTRRMTVSAETRAYWQELGGYYAAAERNGTDHTHPPKPPTADVAFDVSAICAPRASPC